MPDGAGAARVLVTGGRGFLGRFVVRELQARGAAVVAVGSRDYDLREQGDVRRMYEELRPEVVVHLAASCGGIGANVANPGRFLYENALMGLLVLEEARRAGCRGTVLVSTTCAYPKDAPLPLREEHLWDGPPVGATGPYGIAKRMLHEAWRTYYEQYGLPGAVLIPANLYGPEDHFEEHRSHVVPAMIRRFSEAKARGDEVVVNWGTGRATREFLYVEDAARAVAMAVEHLDEPLPMNIGTGVETSMRELASVIAGAVGYKGCIEWDPSKPEGQPRRFLDVRRAKERLGFEAQVDLRDGIERTVAWYRTHGPGRADGTCHS